MATRLEILITAQNRASQDLRRLRQDFDRLSDEVTRNTTANAANARSTAAVGTAMSATAAQARALRTAFIALGGIALFAGAIRTVVEFEQAMQNVRAVSITLADSFEDFGGPEETFRALSEEARRLGAATQFTATQAANGLEFLARAGFTAQESISALEGTLALAASGNLDLGRAADIASNVLSGFNLAAEESNRVADVLAKTAASANTNVEQLGQALSLVAPVSAAFGVSLEETSAAVGALSNAGLQATVAGTGLRRVLAVLGRETPKLSRFLDRAGLSFQDVNVQTVGLTGALQNLADANLTAAEALDIFGARGAPAVLTLASTSTEVERLRQSLEDAEGAANAISGTINDSVIGAFRQLQSAVAETILQEGIDGGLSEQLKELIRDITGVIRALNGTLDPADENAVAYQKAAQAVEALVTAFQILLGLKLVSFLATAVTSISAFATAAVGAATGTRTLALALRLLPAALGPIGIAIAAVSVAFEFFNEETAISTVNSMRLIQQSTARLKEELQDLSSTQIEVRLNREQELLTDTENIISSLQERIRLNQELLATAQRSRGAQAREARERREEAAAQLRADQDSLVVYQGVLDVRRNNILEIEKLQAQARVREAQEALRQEERLQALKGETAQANVAAEVAARQAAEEIAAQALEFEKEQAKLKADIQISELERRLERERDLLEGGIADDLAAGEIDAAREKNDELIRLDQEFYAEKRRLAEEQFRFDLEIIDNERRAREEQLQDEIRSTEFDFDTRVAGADNDAQRQALREQQAARIRALEEGTQAELNALDLRAQAIQNRIIQLQTDQTLAEENAIRDRNNRFEDLENQAITDRENRQKQEFEDRITAIINQREREAAAAERAVESGELSSFQLGTTLDEIDQRAVENLSQVREDMEAFNEAAQDPITQERFITLGDTIEEFGRRSNAQLEQIKTNLAEGLGDALFEIAEGTKDAQTAFRDFAREFLRLIAQMILQEIALNAVRAAGRAFGFSSGGLGAAGGGYIGAATGGYITGKGTSTSDSIPARLSHGEYVMSARAVKGYGLGFMEAINRMALPSPSEGSIPRFEITRPRRMRFADGGAVTDGGKTRETDAQGTPLRIVNVVDTNQTEEYLGSSGGEEQIINIIRRNGSQLRQYLR